VNFLYAMFFLPNLYACLFNHQIPRMINARKNSPTKIRLP
jgi:hypothetical protein